MVLRHTLLLTVIGPLLAAASERGLLCLTFMHERHEYQLRAHAFARSFGRVVGDTAPATAAAAPPAAGQAPEPSRPDRREEIEAVEDAAAFAPLAAQLGEYFCGRRQTFDLPLDLRGTPFQLQVWQQLLSIPYGRLRTYRQVAAEIGRPGAARAVGQAVGDNPVSIVVPCHRVIGAGGNLVGFGGGLTLKGQLLRLEGHTLGEKPRIVEPRLF
ncbi:MAG: methylated-DNA--[protein]-cysteine S-methyltransferase [Candidatus Krumholzibacteriia bacterium]